MTSQKNQSGGVLVLGLFLIITILFVGLLIVDLARLERISEGLQRTADAASLGGAQMLGRPVLDAPSTTAARRVSWQAAKRAALILIRNQDNPVYGASSERETESNAPIDRSNCSGDIDNGGDVNLPCRDFDFQDATVRIERGYYLRDESSGTYEDPIFISLEGIFGGGPDPDHGEMSNLSGISEMCKDNPPGSNPGGATALANAVKVRITLKALPLALGSLLRIFTGPEIAREAVSSIDLIAKRGAIVNPAICQ